MLMSTALPRLVFAALKHQKLLKSQVMSQRLHSNATYEYSYLVGARNGATERVVLHYPHFILAFSLVLHAITLERSGFTKIAILKIKPV